MQHARLPAAQGAAQAARGRKSSENAQHVPARRVASSAG